MIAEDLALPYIGWDIQDSAGELTRVMTVRKAGRLINPATTQTVGSPYQYTPHQWTAGAHKEAEPTDMKLQNLNNTG